MIWTHSPEAHSTLHSKLDYKIVKEPKGEDTTQLIITLWFSLQGFDIPWRQGTNVGIVWVAPFEAAFERFDPFWSA